MRGGKKIGIFIDAISNGTARILPDVGPVFEIPAQLLPDSASEGSEYIMELRPVEDKKNKKTIKNLLDDMGDICAK